jgi:CBS-domain-containing membrane protein
LALSTVIRKDNSSPAEDILGLEGFWLVFAVFVAALFVGGIAATAIATGLLSLLFPEMGALAHDVFTRPAGNWSRSPVYLAITPSLTAVLGLLIAQHLHYGYLAVFLAVGSAILTLEVTRSPIGPSISAALLPVVFNQQSWWYPAGVLVGASVLAILSVLWRRSHGARLRALPNKSRPNGTNSDDTELDELGSSELGSNKPKIFSFWKAMLRPFNKARLRPGCGSVELLFMGLFLALAVFFVNLTGLHLLLYPPLAVIAFEMFTKKETVFGTRQPLLVPVVCCLTAVGGTCAVKFLGVNILAAIIIMAWSSAVLFLLRIHLPPAMAVGLIPLIVTHPSFTYPLAVTAGTLLLTICYFGYRRVVTYAAWKLVR